METQSREILFAPSIYEHAARVVERSPWDVSRDADLMARAHIRAYRLYEHRPIVVGIDIYNLEAEAYGAKIEKPSGNGIPAITSHPFSSTKELLGLEAFDPTRDGRVPMALEVAERVAEECPGADVRAPLSGPFSLATNLMGFENLLCEVHTDPASVNAALKHLVSGQVAFCREVVRRGLDIAFFESAAAPPLLSPASFRDIEMGPLMAIMQQTAEIVGHAVPCILGGDTYPILDYILETGTGYVCCPVATDQEAFMKKMEGHPEVAVRINMDPRPIVSKNVEAIKKEVDRVMALAENRRFVCIGTGCLPFETDPEMVLATKQYILSADIEKD